MSSIELRPYSGDAPPPQGPFTDDAPAVNYAWSSAGEAEREAALARLAAVRRSEDLAAVGFAQLQADRAAAFEAGVAPDTVGNWRRRVKGLNIGERAAALLDRPRPGRPPKMTGAMIRTLEALALYGGPHLTAAHARRVLITRHDWAPSLRHVRFWLARWRADNDRALSAVVNPDRHRSHRRPAFGDAAEAAAGLNAVWELDSTIADVMCADGKRRAMVAAIDVWSRRVKFLIAPASRSEAIATLLRRCLLDWGVPAAIRTDGGRDYTSAHVTGVIKALEIEHLECRPYHPEDKPFVERVIGTVSRDLFANLPGFTGHSVAQAQALRDRTSFAGRRGRSPAVQLGADLDAAELQDRLDAWADSVYARRPHSGLAGVSPFDRARSWEGEVRRVTDERALDALLTPPVQGGGARVVSKKGIPVAGVHYIAPELGRLVKRRVAVRMDPADPSRIFVFDAAGSFICVAHDPAGAHIDRAEIAAKAKALAAREDRTARQRARDLIRAERPEAAMDEVLAAALDDGHRVIMLPRAGKAHETPALSAAADAARAGAEDSATRTGTPARRRGRVVAAASRLYLEDENDE